MLFRSIKKSASTLAALIYMARSFSAHKTNDNPWASLIFFSYLYFYLFTSNLLKNSHEHARWRLVVLPRKRGNRGAGIAGENGVTSPARVVREFLLFIARWVGDSSSCQLSQCPRCRVNRGTEIVIARTWHFRVFPANLSSMTNENADCENKFVVGVYNHVVSFRCQTAPFTTD
jgi:hypothetical protein